MSTTPPSPSHDIVLYARPGCSCCAAARATLLEYGLVFREVDISNDAELRALYSVSAPVVVMDGRVRFRGRVNGPLLRKLLRPPHPLPRQEKLV